MEKDIRLKFESALRKYETAYYADTPADNGDLHYSVRNYFRTWRKIKKICRAKESSSSPRRLAILLAAVLSALVMISAAKKPLTISIIRIYEKYIEFMIRGEDENAPEIIEKVYNAIGYLPKGYYREDVDKTGFSVQTIWRNKENEKLILYQTLYSSVETMMGKESEYEILYVSDIEVMYIERSGRCFYFWNFAGYTFELSGSKSITEEEYIRMISNSLRGER